MSIRSFNSDLETEEIIQKLQEEHGISRSEAIRRAIKFYFEFGLDKETIERIERLSRITKLKKPAVIATAVLWFEEKMNFEVR